MERDGATALPVTRPTMKQPPFFSPSVFNFFHPDHVIDGTNLLGPEFEILDAGTTINRINFVNNLGLRNAVQEPTATNISAPS